MVATSVKCSEVRSEALPEIALAHVIPERILGSRWQELRICIH